MKYVILLNDKPLEQATAEERQKLEERARQSAEKYLGLKYNKQKAVNA